MPSGNNQVIHDLALLPLSTLGALVAIVGATKIDGARANGFHIDKIKVAMVVEGKTVDEGPILYGLAQDLTSLEVEAALEADPQIKGAIPETENANRKVFPLGVIPFNMVDGQADRLVPMMEIHDWPSRDYNEGQKLVTWAYNIGSALTTACILNFFFVYVGRWLND